MPTGTVSVDAVQAVKTIPGELVERSGTLPPAGGEAYYLVTLSYEAVTVEQDFDDKLVPEVDLDPPVITVGHGEDAPELETPTDGGSNTMLISVPEDEGALVITQAGHAQSFSLTKGQRILDEVARTYYRPTQEPIEVDRKLTPPKKKIEATSSGGNTSTVSVTVDGRLEAVELEPWTPGQGWAREGYAWLHLRGEISRQVDSGLIFSAKLDAKITAAVGEEASAADVTLPNEVSETDFNQWVEVPVKTESVEVTLSAGIDVYLLDGWTMEGGHIRLVESQPLSVDLGDAGDG